MGMGVEVSVHDNGILTRIDIAFTRGTCLTNRFLTYTPTQVSLSHPTVRLIIPVHRNSQRHQGLSALPKDRMSVQWRSQELGRTPLGRRTAPQHE
jgi:hypothetical protein